MGTAQIALTGKTMPTLDDLNEIKSNLLSLGDEPGILAKKGETPVDIGPPETGISDDLNALFDGFADVEEDTAPEPESSVPEQFDELTVPHAEGFEDFDLDLDDEPAFDMDGFDAPEPDSSVPEQFDELTVPLVEGDDMDLGSIDPESYNEIEEDGLELDMDSEPENLGFEDLVGISETDEEELSFDADEPDFSVPDSLVPEQFDELTVPLVEEDEIDLSEDAGLSFDDTDLEDLSSGDDFDFDEDTDTDFSLGDSDLDDSTPLDLSGTDSLVPELGEEDDFELPEDEIDLSENEEFSLDDSDDMDLEDFEMGDESFDEELEIDEFDLGDLGQDFGVLEDELSSISNTEIAVDDESVDEVGQEEDEFEIEEKSFERVKATLQNLPRNLKLIIEEEIGEKGLKGPLLKKLIDALAEGKTPKEIASIASKIIGKKIKIPANYAKRTGSDFEDEKESFQYALFHRILPLLKIFLISSLIIAGISFVSYKFIYRPVHAYILYNRGYQQLEESNYNRSEDLFDEAFDKYKIKKQFYRFADGYKESNQFEFARKQYDKLLFNYPFDKKGTIDYATMEFEKLADYEYSTDILNNYLIEDKYKRDYEALLLLGDIYLEWGGVDYDKYDDARLAYAKIMNTYGVENKILFRMLRYFIRTIMQKRWKF